MSYQVVTADYTSDLSVKVRDLIAAGWEPLGGVTVDRRVSSTCFHQAMVRTVSKQEKQEAKRYRLLRDDSINTSWSFCISTPNEDTGRTIYSTHKGNKGTPEGMDEELDEIIDRLEHP